MKKLLFLLLASTFVCSLFATEKVKNDKTGTYIPEIVYNEILDSKSYFKGIEKSNIKNLYSVICISDKGIFSNVKFHDAYQLNETEISFSFKSKKGTYYLLDNNTGLSYIKISDTENYYDAYDAFLKENVLDKLNIVNAKIEVQDTRIFVNEKEFKIDKDQWHYSKDLNLILYSADRKTFIGLCEENNNTYIYTLKNGEMLQKVIDYKW